jgi:hypothetical protein
MRGRRAAGPRRTVPRGATLAEKLAFHSVLAPSGCWVWLGAIDTRSTAGPYGRVDVDGRSRAAHRVSYELHVGPIPEGHQIDHLCRYPRCINPRHLQAVTPQVNTLRGTSPSARAKRGDMCMRGHRYTAANTRDEGARRKCRKCEADRARVRYHRLKAAA